MLEEHLACPKCGYDLHGIPAVRCPECGFRYDAAGLRTVHESAEAKRLATARGIIVRGAAAIFLVLPAVCERAGVAGWPQLFILVAVYILVFATWMWMTDVYRGLVSLPNLIVLFVTIGIGLSRVPRPLIFLAGCVVLMLAWMMRLRDWPRLATVENARATEFRRVVERHSLGATVVLVVATLLAGWGVYATAL